MTNWYSTFSTETKAICIFDLIDEDNPLNVISKIIDENYVPNGRQILVNEFAQYVAVRSINIDHKTLESHQYNVFKLIKDPWIISEHHRRCLTFCLSNRFKKELSKLTHEQLDNIIRQY